MLREKIVNAINAANEHLLINTKRSALGTLVVAIISLAVSVFILYRISLLKIESTVLMGISLTCAFVPVLVVGLYRLFIARKLEITAQELAVWKGKQKSVQYPKEQVERVEFYLYRWMSYRNVISNGNIGLSHKMRIVLKNGSFEQYNIGKTATMFECIQLLRKNGYIVKQLRNNQEVSIY
jgi:hypothetical protein